MNGDKSLHHGLDDLLVSLDAQDLDKAVSAVWSYSHDIGSTDHSSIVSAEVASGCRRLKWLLTENTGICTPTFLEFSQGLAHSISAALEYDTHASLSADRVRETFVDYWRNPNNFKPLAHTTRLAQGQWGDFLWCTADRENIFFATTSGEVETHLVHFDQWFRPDTSRCGELLLDRCADSVNEIIGDRPDDWSVVLVNKEYGPNGPAGVWGKLRGKLKVPPSTYHYDQESNSGNFDENAAGTSKQFVVLYDLINHGDGVKEIVDHLRGQRQAQAVKSVLLYDYYNLPISEGKIAREDVSCVFDAQQYAALRHSGLSALAETAETKPDLDARVFARAERSPESIDPTYAAKGIYDEWAIESKDLRAKYAGQWVAITDDAILASAGTRESLNKVISEQHPGVRVAYHYYHPWAA